MEQVASKCSLKAIFSTAAIAAALTLSACSTPADPDVKARQDIMKNYGDAMGVMGGMAKEPSTFDAEVFKEQAAYMAGDAASPWSHFGNAESVGKSTPAVWSNPEGFRAEAENFQQVTAQLNETAQTATTIEQVLPAFGPVGDSCKSCHTDYKVKDD